MNERAPGKAHHASQRFYRPAAAVRVWWPDPAFLLEAQMITKGETEMENKEEKRVPLTRMLQVLDFLKAMGFEGTAKTVTAVWPCEDGGKLTSKFVIELKKEILVEDDILR
jgi:hypothetical protein